MQNRHVVRIWGTVDTMSVLFTPLTADYSAWKTEFYDPDPKDGYQYILTLYLEDRAGNIGYFATIIFEVDLKCMTARWSVESYNAYFTSDDCGEEYQNMANAFGLCK